MDVESDATDEEVERAYRRRVLEAHPDHGGSTHEFQQVRSAYETILSEDAEAPELNGDDSADGESDGDNDSDGEAGEDPADREPEGVRVEYLDYEALADRGWQITDDDLFEKAADAALDVDEFGAFVAPPDDSLLEAAEEHGLRWPYACRGGACSNCAVALVDGEMPMPNDHILPEKWLDRGIRLSCLSAPTSDSAKVVSNVKHLPGLDDLRLPLSRFDKARLND
nr:ferredoxin Fer [Halomarina oriensis]